MNVQEEQRRQATFAVILAIVLAAGSLFTFFLAREQYSHPMPEQDCSQPYDYPMCARAAEPGVRPEPPVTHVYLSVMAVGILAVILLFLSHGASVTRQEGLVAFNTRGGQLQAEKQAPRKAQHATEVQQPQPEERDPATEAQGEFPGGRTPDTIPNNTIAPDEIAPQPKREGGNA